MMTLFGLDVRRKSGCTRTSVARNRAVSLSLQPAADRVWARSTWPNAILAVSARAPPGLPSGRKEIGEHYGRYPLHVLEPQRGFGSAEVPSN